MIGVEWGKVKGRGLPGRELPGWGLPGELWVDVPAMAGAASRRRGGKPVRFDAAARSFSCESFQLSRVRELW